MNDKHITGQNDPAAMEVGETKKTQLWQKKSNQKKKLLDSKVFLMGASVLIAFSVWVGLSFSDTTTEISRKIEDVPVVYENLPDNIKELGLEVIEHSIQVDKVDVTVYGKQYVVNQLDPSDLMATVKYRDVTGAGRYVGEIQVTGIKTYWNFQITGTSVRTVEVLLDRMTTQEFSVEYETNSYRPADGYTLRVPKLADTSVTITGTTGDIAQIHRVVAKANVPSTINSTATYPAMIVLEDEAGNELKGLDVEISLKQTELSIAAMRVKEVPVRIIYLNAPSYMGNMVSLSMNKVELAFPADMEDSVKEIVLGTIDFSEVDLNNHTFDFNINHVLPVGCINQSGENIVRATIKTNDLAVKQFEVTDIRIKNTTGATAQVVTKSVNLTVVGNISQLSTMTADDISLTVDVSSYKNSTGKHVLPASASIVNGSRCWVYGEPTVLVQIGEPASN